MKFGVSQKLAFAARILDPLGKANLTPNMLQRMMGLGTPMDRIMDTFYNWVRLRTELPLEKRFAYPEGYHVPPSWQPQVIHLPIADNQVATAGWWPKIRPGYEGYGCIVKLQSIADHLGTGDPYTPEGYQALLNQLHPILNKVLVGMFADRSQNCPITTPWEIDPTVLELVKKIEGKDASTFMALPISFGRKYAGQPMTGIVDWIIANGDFPLTQAHVAALLIALPTRFSYGAEGCVYCAGDSPSRIWEDYHATAGDKYFLPCYQRENDPYSTRVECGFQTITDKLSPLSGPAVAYIADYLR